MSLFYNALLVLLSISFTVEECGRPIGNEFRLEEDRVVAGYDIGYYRYPWYAILTRYNQVACGGTLVASKTIVTAAHCYKEFLNLASKGVFKLEQAYIVKLGVYNICTAEKTSRSYTVEKVHIHQLYYTKKPYYDISVLILNGDTPYTPICLPTPHSLKKPLDGTVPGLGTLRYHGAMPCTVHEARLLVHNQTECFDMINSTGNDPNLIENAFCAGYLQGGIDTCQGDSGGPLQGLSESGNYVLVGIVSFGFRCAVPGLLGMYTDVAQYVDWIKEKSAGQLQIVPVKDEHAIGTNNESESAPHKHHKKGHLWRPYRRPIRIIIYKNNKWNVETKMVLHRPIIRSKRVPN
ncbi:unnamed protein product [Phyllotreta striolata]|uniref:Peptidase S1 domain-containing protein n=1 Tax=Phyllotreta striolata TaxID=444603 RepID=A0A9N9XN51_PHYSR|nr:unnamed protein product [Phyllotreta striolata]